MLIRRWPFFSALLLSLSVVTLDQMSKFWMNHRLIMGVPRVILPIFNLTLAYNPGAAFSFLSEGSGWQLLLFSGFSIVVSVVLCVWLWRLPEGAWAEASALALILGGAVGNLIDRVRLGYVIDFLDFHWGAWHFPYFNIADTAITLGACGLIMCFICAKEESKK